jgi:hypothetical protein
VDAEERQGLIGDGVHERTHEATGIGDERGVVASEGDDPASVVGPGGGGQAVGLQARAHHDGPGDDRSGVGLDHRFGVARPDPLSGPTEQHVDPGCPQVVRERRRDPAHVDDAGGGHVQCPDRAHVRLDLARCRRIEQAQIRHPIRRSLIVERLQARKLFLARRDHELAAALERHRVLLAEAFERDPALRHESRLERSAPVRDRGVHHAGVVEGLMRADLPLLVQDGDAQPGTRLHQPPCRREPDDARAHDRDVVPVAHPSSVRSLRATAPRR